MKAERTLPEVPTLRASETADESPTAKVRRLRAVKNPSAWDPYEVWRTRVKRKNADAAGQSE